MDDEDSGDRTISLSTHSRMYKVRVLLQLGYFMKNIQVSTLTEPRYVCLTVVDKIRSVRSNVCE